MPSQPPAPAAEPTREPDAKAEPRTPTPAPEAAPTPTPAPTLAADAPKPVRVDPKPDGVTVVSPGNEPRGPLRIAPAVGAEQRVELRMKMELGIVVGTQNVPPTAMPEVTVVMTNAVKSTGDTIRYDFSVEQARRAEGEFSERVVRAIDEAVQAMQRTKGTFTIDARGTVREANIDGPALPEGLRPSFTGFQQSFGQLYPLLPEEPVGQGAQWKAISHFDLGGVPIEQEATYALVRREGDKIELTVSFTQAATTATAAADASRTHNASLGGGGTGTVTLDLRNVAPLKGSAHSRNVTVSTLEVAKGQSVTMDMTLDLQIDGGT